MKRIYQFIFISLLSVFVLIIPVAAIYSLYSVMVNPEAIGSFFGKIENGYQNSVEGN